MFQLPEPLCYYRAVQKHSLSSVLHLSACGVSCGAAPGRCGIAFSDNTFMQRISCWIGWWLCAGGKGECAYQALCSLMLTLFTNDAVEARERGREALDRFKKQQGKCLAKDHFPSWFRAPQKGLFFSETFFPFELELLALSPCASRFSLDILMCHNWVSSFCFITAPDVFLH